MRGSTTVGEEQAALGQTEAAALLAGSHAAADPASDLRQVLVWPDLSVFVVADAVYELDDQTTHVRPGNHKPGTIKITADFHETVAWFQQRNDSDHSPRKSLSITMITDDGAPGRTYTFEYGHGAVTAGTLVSAPPVCETAADCAGVVDCAAPVCASDHTCQCNQEIFLSRGQ